MSSSLHEEAISLLSIVQFIDEASLSKLALRVVYVLWTDTIDEQPMRLELGAPTPWAELQSIFLPS